MALRSQNWRIRVEQPLAGDRVGAKAHLYRPSDRDHVQQRNNRDEGANGNELSPSLPKKPSLRGEDDPRTLQAIAEGRRLYVGNLPYIAKTRDVESLFEGENYQIEHINMSIDPYTGRNPSYCFVELTDPEMAKRAIQQLNGKSVLGRPPKLSPGLAGSKGKRPPNRTPQDARPIFDRWTRTDAADHWKGYADEDHRVRRVFVGRLPRMPDHHTVNEDVRHMFRDYNVEAVSKVIVPESPAFGDRRDYNHRYLFVDFSSADEAQHAVKEFNGRMAWGVKICVQPSSSSSRKIHERDDYDDGNHDLPNAPSSLSYD
ncbi:MAG: hypothetical protein Q9202_003708 [Teloschistes flavicans]